EALPIIEPLEPARRPWKLPIVLGSACAVAVVIESWIFARILELNKLGKGFLLVLYAFLPLLLACLIGILCSALLPYTMRNQESQTENGALLGGVALGAAFLIFVLVLTLAFALLQQFKV